MGKRKFFSFFLVRFWHFIRLGCGHWNEEHHYCVNNGNVVEEEKEEEEAEGKSKSVMKLKTPETTSIERCVENGIPYCWNRTKQWRWPVRACSLYQFTVAQTQTHYSSHACIFVMVFRCLFYNVFLLLRTINSSYGVIVHFDCWRPASAISQRECAAIIPLVCEWLEQFTIVLRNAQERTHTAMMCTWKNHIYEEFAFKPRSQWIYVYGIGTHLMGILKKSCVVVHRVL